MKTTFALIVLATLCAVSMAGYLGGAGLVGAGRDAGVTVSFDNQRAAPYGGLGAYGAYGLGYAGLGYGGYGLGYGGFGYGLGYGHGLGYGLGYGGYGLGYGLGFGKYW